MGVPVRLRAIPLWAEKWDKEALKKRAETEPRAFERGFRLRAFSDEEVTFPSFAQCRVHGVGLGEIQRSNWPKFTGVDLSSKKRPGNAIVTVAVDPGSRRRFPIDIRYGAWKSNETCEALADVNRLYRPVVIMVEDNAYQAALIEWAQALKGSNDFWMKLEPTTTTDGNKMHADLGLPSLQVEFKNKSWVVPYSAYEGASPDDRTKEAHWARWDYEFRNHPLAATSDGVMATWFARQGIEIYGGGAVPVDGDLNDINRR